MRGRMVKALEFQFQFSVKQEFQCQGVGKGSLLCRPGKATSACDKFGKRFTAVPRVDISFMSVNRRGNRLGVMDGCASL